MSNGWTPQMADEHNRRVAKGKNPHVYSGTAAFDPQGPPDPIECSPEMPANAPTLPLQASFTLKPSTDEQKLNKTEKRYLDGLRLRLRAGDIQWIGIQCITLKFGADLRFTPDFAYMDIHEQMVMVDTKGGFAREDSRIKIKAAARIFTMFRFIIAKYDKNTWTEEIIKP